MPPTATSHTETLARVPLFSGFSPEELGFLVQRAVPRRFSPGETVFSEGEPCLGMYLVASGQVRIFKTSAAGREQILSIDGPGNSIAEVPVFDGGNYPASCTSVGETALLFISKQDFHAVCLAHPQVPLKVLRTVGARLRQLVGIIEELSFTTVRQRLIALLVRQAEATGRRSKDGLRFELTKSHQELAAELGTVRELVSRNLSRLQAEGFLEVEGRKIVVKNLAGLKQERACEAERAGE
jgi:CRP/FNR family transcriptional regulator